MNLFEALHVPPSLSASDPLARTLRQAIDRGLAGDQAKAHALLADYFRASRESEWAWVKHQATRTDWGKPGAGRKLTPAQRRILVVNPGNFDWRDITPDLDALIRSPSPSRRARLVQQLTTLNDRRDELSRVGAYPLFTMLGTEGQFDLFYRGYLTLIRTGDLEPALADGLLSMLLQIGEAMYRDTQRYMVHNIFTAGVCGLFRVARALPEFKHAAAWDAHALEHLNTDLDRSFFPDGGHAERNWAYGSYTLRRMIEIRRFALERGGLGPYAQRFEDRLREIFRFYAKTLGPGDISPGFGDEGPADMAHVLDEAIRTDLFPPGTTRDVGVDRSISYFLPHSGVAIFRNGAGPQAAFADVTFGDFAGWHSHMDSLSMDLHAMGSVLLQEVPRFGPYHHPMDILWRETQAHNQLLVDGFFYDSRPLVGQDVFWHSDAAIDYFSAVHTAYRVLPPQEGWRTKHASADLIVRRTIVFVKDPGYALVLDSVHDEHTGRFNRSTSGWWHSPQALRVLGPGLARTVGGKGEASCLLTFARPEAIRRMEIGDDFTPEDSAGQIHGDRHWRHLRVNTWRRLPYEGSLGLAAALVPFKGSRVPQVSLRTLALQGQDDFRVEALEARGPWGKDLFVLNPERRENVAYRGQAVGRALIRLGGRRGEATL